MQGNADGNVYVADTLNHTIRKIGDCALITDTLFLAQFGDGGGLTSDIVLKNPSADDTVTGRVDFFGGDGSPLSIDIAESSQPLRVGSGGVLPRVQKTGVDFEIGPRDSVTISTTGQGQSALVGAAVVSASGRLGGVVRFSVSVFDPGIMGVGQSSPVAGFITPVRRKEGGINTGVALHNPGGAPIDITLRLLRDGAEVDVIVLEDFPARGHTAKFINELFEDVDTSDFVGTLVVTVEGGMVTATALEQALAPGQFTALPVTPLN